MKTRTSETFNSKVLQRFYWKTESEARRHIALTLYTGGKEGAAFKPEKVGQDKHGDLESCKEENSLSTD